MSDSANSIKFQSPLPTSALSSLTGIGKNKTEPMSLTDSKVNSLFASFPKDTLLTTGMITPLESHSITNQTNSSEEELPIIFGSSINESEIEEDAPIIFGASPNENAESEPIIFGNPPSELEENTEGLIFGDGIQIEHENQKPQESTTIFPSIDFSNMKIADDVSDVLIVFDSEIPTDTTDTPVNNISNENIKDVGSNIRRENLLIQKELDSQIETASKPSFEFRSTLSKHSFVKERLHARFIDFMKESNPSKPIKLTSVREFKDRMDPTKQADREFSINGKKFTDYGNGLALRLLLRGADKNKIEKEEKAEFEELYRGNKISQREYEQVINAAYMTEDEYENEFEQAFKDILSQYKHAIIFENKAEENDHQKTYSLNSHSPELANINNKKETISQKRTVDKHQHFIEQQLLQDIHKHQKELDKKIQEERLQQEREFADEMKQIDKSKDEKFRRVLQEEEKRQENLRQVMHTFYTKHQLPAIKVYKSR